MWFKRDTNKKLFKKTALGIDYLEIPGDPEAATIVLLHGFGANNEDLLALSNAYTGEKKPTWIFPNGPNKISIGLFDTGRIWFDIDIPLLQKAFHEKNFAAIEEAFPEKIQSIREKLDQFLIELKIPQNQLIIGGFSQGAVLALELALYAREVFRGLVIFSGTLIHRKIWAEQAMHKIGLTYLQTHGTEDSLLPIDLARELHQLLQTSGLHGKFHVFDGGHEIDHSSLSHFKKFLMQLC